MHKSTSKKLAAPRAVPMDTLKVIVGGDPGKQGGHMSPTLDTSITLPQR